MSSMNRILTASSLLTLLVIAERLSFTTQIILEPYNFLRLHEVVQMLVLILISVILPFFVLKIVTKNFELLKTTKGTFLGLLFIIGIYFYATGNGAHEIASYIFNTFCPTKQFIGNKLCESAYFNDYYFGNIVFFVGYYFMILPLVLFERMNPQKSFTKTDIIVIVTNALVYGFSVFAYAAFDPASVGLIFTIVTALTLDMLLLTSGKRFMQLPFTSYSATAMTLAAIGILLVRLQ